MNRARTARPCDSKYARGRAAVSCLESCDYDLAAPTTGSGTVQWPGRDRPTRARISRRVQGRRVAVAYREPPSRASWVSGPSGIIESAIHDLIQLYHHHDECPDPWRTVPDPVPRLSSLVSCSSSLSRGRRVADPVTTKRQESAWIQLRCSVQYHIGHGHGPSHHYHHQPPPPSPHHRHITIHAIQRVTTNPVLQ